MSLSHDKSLSENLSEFKLFVAEGVRASSGQISKEDYRYLSSLKSNWDRFIAPQIESLSYQKS